jgi:BirA family transcriptional regulator, biotin operon repressor / biotin---[acetyl-CoA-carboxylase] ligase
MQTLGFLTHNWCQKRQLPVEFFPSLDSTSSYAKTLMNDPLENHKPLHVVVTDLQTAGRGRGTHTWISPEAGKSLLVTWSFRLTRPPQPVTSARIGLALYNALTKAWPQVPFSLKAPNDLYLNDKKVAGILLEAIEQGPHIRLLVGLGLNVFEAPALETATSLKSSIEEELLISNWEFFLDELYRELQMACDQLSHHLSSFDCERLLECLNQFPLLKEKYLSIDPDGSLHSSTTKTHWWNL